MTLNEIISRHQLKVTITVRRRKGLGIKQLTAQPPWAYCEISGDMGFSKRGRHHSMSCDLPRDDVVSVVSPR